MRYLVLGADGQLGKEWLEVLNKNNDTFWAYERNDLDITDYIKIKEYITTLKPEVIINCAAYTAVDKAEEEVLLAHSINYTAVEYLADLSKEYNIKLVHYSTDYVFAGTMVDQKNYPNGYPETAATYPVNSYGLSKLKGEQAIKESGCDYLILRLSWLCGRYGDNFVKTMIRLSKERDTLTVVNDQYGVPTFTHPAVLNSIALIEMNASGVYHIGSKGIISWYDFAKKIFELSDLSINVTAILSATYNTPAKRPFFSKLDTKKIETELNTPSMQWEEGLSQLLKKMNYEDC